MIYAFLLTPLALLSLSFVHAEDFLSLPNLPAQLQGIDQGLHSPKSCGPAALLTALKFGSEVHRKAFTTLPGTNDQTRLTFVVDRFFRRPSQSFRDSPRWTLHGGCTQMDLAEAVKEAVAEFGLPKIRHHEWIRPLSESHEDFVFRVHRDLHHSLRHGTPPIVELRTQTCEQEPDGTWRWKVLVDHYVTIIAITKELHSGKHGFRFQFLDPSGGQKHEAHVFAEPHLSLTSFAGEGHRGRWITGSRSLRVVAPTAASLWEKPKEPHQLITCTLHYFLGS
ncbi:MAG: hypothetical protein AAF191_15035 [Verrucomicrobiota bacterium]